MYPGLTLGGIYSIIPTRFARPFLQLRRLYALTFLVGSGGFRLPGEDGPAGETIRCVPVAI
jgi:hypothetical protein